MSDEQKALEGEKPGAQSGAAPAEGHAQAATATEEGRETAQDEAAARPDSPNAELIEPFKPNDRPVTEVAESAPLDKSQDVPAAVPPPASLDRPTSTAGDADATAEFETALNAFEGEKTGTSYDDAFRPLSRGELLTARVIQVDKDKVFVDLGTKSEGVVPLEELSSVAFENANDIVKVGDEIKVVVLNPQGREGNPIVSRKRAEFEAAWDRIVEEFDQKKTVSAVVTERVKGGLVVDLGVRGFVPATHVGNGQIRNLDKFVGQSMQFKIIEVDRDRRKVVLSNRLAEEESREQKKKDIFNTVKPGEIMDGVVRRIVDYGAFVDLGGVDGLLHVSEMSWSRVDHPREVLKEGEEVRVMVLRLDPNSGRISLGRRQVLPDPWSAIRENYSIGQRITLPISRVVQSGAFVKLSEGAEAFIPISEMSHRRIMKPSEVVSAGQDVDVQIVDLRPDERRMVLSMRALLPNEERQHHHERREEIRPRGERSRDRDRGRGRDRDREEGRGHQSAAPGNLTIGERLSALKGLQGYEAAEEAPVEAPTEAPKDAPPPAEEAAKGTPEE